MFIVIICADDNIPVAVADGELIASVVRRIGLCSEVVEFSNVDRSEILNRLADTVEQMAKVGISHLMIYYAGHAFARSMSRSTRVVTTENRCFPLESSVQKAIQEVQARRQFGPCKVVYFVDACQEFEDDEHWDSGDSSMSEPEDLMQYFVYSVQRGKPSVDNGLFATALAYCLTCRVQTLSTLFRNVRDLVSQLSFWRQIPYTSDVDNDIELFPRTGGSDIQWPLMEKHRDQRLFQSTFFLSRYLATLTSDNLVKARGIPQDSVDFLLRTESTFRMLREIADVFEAKKHLFNSWVELELLVACPCDDLESFLEELNKVEQLPCLTETVPTPKSVPQEIRDCLVDALREQVRDDYDPRPKDCGERMKPTGTLIADVRELVYELMDWFKEYDGTPVETKDGTKKWTYALVAEQAEVAPLPESELRVIAEFINEQSEVFSVPYRVFLAPGSLWIIIRSQGRLPISEFLKGITESIEQRPLSKVICKAVPRLRRVPLHVVPQRFFNLVYQVENLLESSDCLWLRALDVQKLAANRINQSKGGVQLKQSHVIVFEDSFAAESLSWLSGHGKLRFVIQTNWRDLILPNWLLDMLNELASRSIGMFSSTTWGEHFAFHAVAFLLHRRMEYWKLDDHREVINVLPGAHHCIHPTELLQGVLRKVLKEGSQALQKQAPLAEMMYHKAMDALLALHKLAEKSSESIVLEDGMLGRIFREVYERQNVSSTGKFDLQGSFSQVHLRQSETSTNVPNSSSNLHETLPETGLEDSDTEEGEHLRIEQHAKALHGNIRAGQFQCPGPHCGAAKLCKQPCDAFSCDVCGNRIPSKISFWHCLKCGRGICPDCASKSEVTVSQKLIETECAMACRDRGELTKAELGFQRLLDSNSDLVEEIMLKFELGRVKQKMNKLQEAETIFLEALATAEARTGCEMECETILHELGVLQREKREFLQAEKCLRKSLNMKIMANAETHRVVATVVELGRVLHEIHGGHGAIGFAQKVLALGEYRGKVQLDEGGRRRQCFAKAFHELGKWSQKLGDLDSAEHHFIESLAMEYSFDEGQDDASFAVTLHELGLVFKRKGKKSAAEICFREALYRKRRANCPDVKLTEEELGTLYTSEPSLPSDRLM